MGKSNSAISEWLEAAGRIPLLPKAETLRLATIIQSEDSSEKAKKKAIDKLIIHNMKLVPAVVRRCVSNKRSFKFGSDWTEDLLQCGAMGLYRAAKKFDPTRGYCFSTYAVTWIFQAVQREICNNISTIRVPESTIREMYQAINENRNLSFSGISESKRIRLIDAFNAMGAKSIEAIASSCNSRSSGQMEASNLSKIEPISIDELIKHSEGLPVYDTFEEIISLAKLSDIQVEVLRLHYVSNMTYTQIEKELEMERSSARNIAVSALNRLRQEVSW